jgi:hypothetical protein
VTVGLVLDEPQGLAGVEDTGQHSTKPMSLTSTKRIITMVK